MQSGGGRDRAGLDELDHRGGLLVLHEIEVVLVLLDLRVELRQRAVGLREPPNEGILTRTKKGPRS